MNGDQQAGLSAGGAIFARLKMLGVSHVFTNSGTDFPPVIEGLIAARRQGHDLPQPVVVPHEHAAVAMAHGFYQISGRPQAVMLHTNVGLANGLIGLINAWCDQVPMIVMSGRTPVTESGRFGARTVPIGWGQEMFDQAAMLREVVKWDYELRFPEQLPELLDRAWAIANSTPRGPVYLGLPREVLCEAIPPAALAAAPAMAPVHAAPDPAALERAADLLAGARAPLVISQRGAGSAAGFAALSRFLDDWALPLSHYWANQLSVPLDHPMQVGADPGPWLAEADVVLVLNALAPWFPDRMRPPPGAQVIQLGPDPLFSRTPVRHFPAHVSLAGDTDAALAALIAAMAGRRGDRARRDARRARIAAAAARAREETRTRAMAGGGAPMTKDWVSLCLGEAIDRAGAKGRATVFHELGCPLMPLGAGAHLSYMQEPHSGGLGWGLPAALGAQLADPERLIFATMGDGSYMFANPTACHMVAEALALPVITLVLNNEEWGAVRQSAQALYPGGLAAQSNDVPLTGLRPSPDFTQTARASRAHAETVTEGAALPAALDRAIAIARGEGRQVLLNIAIARE